MARRRWIADQFEGDRAVLTGEHAAHLVRVLRARVGQEFEISAGGRVRLGQVLSVAPGRVEFHLGEDVPQPRAQQVTIFLSIFKFDRMEWAIEKATELGVDAIYPLAARRSDPRLVAAASKRVERWRRLALQASQQARRIAPPLIESPQTLQQALGQPFDLALVLAETERVTSLRRALRPATPASHVALALGPEGGWTSDELAEFTRAGWQPVSLGPGILRAETAAIAALAVVMAEVHDLSSG
jgi:16S rRNA (uracil1498-N3)-methyltransferase